jgi:hypothetical protein
MTENTIANDEQYVTYFLIAMGFMCLCAFGLYMMPVISMFTNPGSISAFEKYLNVVGEILFLIAGVYCLATAYNITKPQARAELVVEPVPTVMGGWDVGLGGTIACAFWGITLWLVSNVPTVPAAGIHRLLICSGFSFIGVAIFGGVTLLTKGPEKINLDSIFVPALAVFIGEAIILIIISAFLP